MGKDLQIIQTPSVQVEAQLNSSTEGIRATTLPAGTEYCRRNTLRTREELGNRGRSLSLGAELSGTSNSSTGKGYVHIQRRHKVRILSHNMTEEAKQAPLASARVSVLCVTHQSSAVLHGRDLLHGHMIEAEMHKAEPEGAEWGSLESFGFDQQ